MRVQTIHITTSWFFISFVALSIFISSKPDISCTFLSDSKNIAIERFRIYGLYQNRDLRISLRSTEGSMPTWQEHLLWVMPGGTSGRGQILSGTNMLKTQCSHVKHSAHMLKHSTHLWRHNADIWRHSSHMWRHSVDMWRYSSHMWKHRADMWKHSVHVWRLSTDMWRQKHVKRVFTCEDTVLTCENTMLTCEDIVLTCENSAHTWRHSAVMWKHSAHTWRQGFAGSGRQQKKPEHEAWESCRATSHRAEKRSSPRESPHVPCEWVMFTWVFQKAEKWSTKVQMDVSSRFPNRKWGK